MINKELLEWKNYEEEKKRLKKKEKNHPPPKKNINELNTLQKKIKKTKISKSIKKKGGTT